MQEPTPEQLARLGYVKGEYMITCGHCDLMADGCDKRAVSCLTCATKAYSELQSKNLFDHFAEIAAEAEMEGHPKKRYWHPREGEQFVYENEIILFELTDSSGNKMVHVGKIAAMHDDGWAPPTFDVDFRATWVGENVRGGIITLEKMLIWRYMLNDRDPTPVELEDIRGAFTDEAEPTAFYRNAEGTRVHPWGQPALTVV